MVCRDLTPLPEDCIDRVRAETHRYHDELVALGGRSTRPIQQYPNSGTAATDGKIHYRDEYEKIEVIFEVDKDRSISHWTEEMDRCGYELRGWQEFKVAQRLHNQNGRSELELELENTDTALIGVLNKLNDWQEFESMHQRAVHEAEDFLERCQQANAENQNAMVAATYANPMLKLRKSTGGWKGYMRRGQERLDTSQNKLVWVKSQWKEVIAEACSLIATAPKLQEQLEAKFEKQTRAVYRTLVQQGFRPSHVVYPPDKDVEFPLRLQHWINESSAFIAELRDWRLFMLWRRDVREAGGLNLDGRKVISEDDSCSGVFKDLVEYQQHELEKSLSWVDFWRGQLRKHLEASRGIRRYGGSSTSRNRRKWPFYGWNGRVDDDDDDDDDDDSSDDEADMEARRAAEVYAMHAEEKVSVAAKRLEDSKQKLQAILAESGPPSTSQNTAADTKIQTPPAQPKSPPPEILRKSLGSSKQKGSGGNGYRRSKKERARRREANMVKANTEQHALPNVSLSSKNLDEDDEDTQMSNDAEDPSPIELKKKSNQKDSEDAVMSDAEDRTDRLPSSLPGPHPRPIPQYTKLPSSSSPSPVSRRTRSATKRDQVPSFKVLKKPSKNKPTKKTKVFTNQQQIALFNAAATEHPTAAPTSLGRIQQNPPPTPSISTHNS